MKKPGPPLFVRKFTWSWRNMEPHDFSGYLHDHKGTWSSMIFQDIYLVTKEPGAPWFVKMVTWSWRNLELHDLSRCLPDHEGTRSSMICQDVYLIMKEPGAPWFVRIKSRLCLVPGLPNSINNLKKWKLKTKIKQTIQKNLKGYIERCVYIFTWNPYFVFILILSRIRNCVIMIFICFILKKLSCWNLEICFL